MISKCNTNQLSIWYLPKKVHIRQTKKAYQNRANGKQTRKKNILKEGKASWGAELCRVAA